MPTLAERVQALPQELYDEIVELTLSPDEEVEINGAYLPPPTLQLNRATRSAAAKSFYSGTIFTTNDPKLLFSWLVNLPKEHVRHITTIHRFKQGEEILLQGDRAQAIGSQMLSLLLMRGDWEDWEEEDQAKHGRLISYDQYLKVLKVRVRDAEGKVVWRSWGELKLDKNKALFGE